MTVSHRSTLAFDRILRVRSWRARLLLAFIGLLLPVAAWRAYDLERDSRRQEAVVLEEQVQTARVVAGALEAAFRDLDRDLALVAEEIERDRPAAAVAAAYLASARPLVWPADLLVLVDAGGAVRAAAPNEDRGDLVGSSLQDFDPVLRGGRASAVGSLIADTRTGRLVVGTAHAVRDGRGAVAGLIIGFVPADTFGEALGSPQFTPDTALTLVDRAGRIVYDSTAPHLPWQARDRSAVPDVRSALAGRVARVEALEDASDGVVRTGAAVPAPSVGWAVRVFRARDAALAPARAALWRAAVTLVVLAVVLAGAAWLLAARIAGPVQALKAGAEALGAGRLDVRVPVDSSDELGQLGRTFNAMADRLERQVEETRVAERRAAFLAEASARLAASLDYQTTLASVARLAVPEFADYCFVDLIEAGQSIRRLAVAHVDPAKEAVTRELTRYPPDPDGPHPVSRVLSTGEPELVRDMPDSLLTAGARDAEHLEILRKLSPRSMMTVPLVAHGRALGALTFVSAESGRRYEAADLALAEELARRAALAVDSARLYREAQSAIRAREAFFARASHELRTPLTSALGTIRLLKRAREGESSGPPDELIDMASRSLDATLAFINDLLDTSKLAAGQETLAVEPVELAALVTRSLDVIGAQAREKGVTLRAAVPTGLRLRADPLKLEQVLINLLTNAVKFTPDGGEVTVEAEADARGVLIRVRDTGDGIARDHLEQVFEPFFQAREPGVRPRPASPGDASGARRPRGTGLGLAICRQIVTLHEGRIWAESDGPGRGATFTVALPARSAAGRAA